MAVLIWHEGEANETKIHDDIGTWKDCKHLLRGFVQEKFVLEDEGNYNKFWITILLKLHSSEIATSSY
jgi:hypothetical protein